MYLCPLSSTPCPVVSWIFHILLIVTCVLRSLWLTVRFLSNVRAFIFPSAVGSLAHSSRWLYTVCNIDTLAVTFLWNICWTDKAISIYYCYFNILISLLAFSPCQPVFTILYIYIYLMFYSYTNEIMRYRIYLQIVVHAHLGTLFVYYICFTFCFTSLSILFFFVLIRT